MLPHAEPIQSLRLPYLHSLFHDSGRMSSDHPDICFQFGLHPGTVQSEDLGNSRQYLHPKHKHYRFNHGWRSITIHMRASSGRSAYLPAELFTIYHVGVPFTHVYMGVFSYGVRSDIREVFDSDAAFQHAEIPTRVVLYIHLDSILIDYNWQFFLQRLPNLKYLMLHHRTAGRVH